MVKRNFDGENVFCLFGAMRRTSQNLTDILISCAVNVAGESNRTNVHAIQHGCSSLAL